MKKGLTRAFLLISLLSWQATVFGQGGDNTLFLISNSHLDTQWNWDVRTTINEYLPRTMEQNFRLLDKYPNFYFNFEGAIRYMWMKEYYPENFAKLKGYVARGRWHVSGCAVDANDVMTTSAESILRNWLLANQFYKKEFGVRGGYDVMLPDCFGFSYALPSLARHAGMKGFHTAKLGWGSPYYDELAPFGVWQGVDGSQLYAIYKPHAYDTHEEYNKDLSRDASIQKAIADNASKYGLAAEMRYVGPRSDHGGGLRDEASTTGENTPYWLDRSVSADGPTKVVLTSPDAIFEAMEQHRSDKYQVWNGELPMTTHGVGAYTSRAMLKRWNRKTELLADAAEKSASLAQWYGLQSYPQTDMNEAWIRMLWQQHHDGITGTSIPNAYVFSENEYLLANKTFAKSLTGAVGALASSMNTSVEGTPVVVYNPLSFDRTDVVEGSMHVGAEPVGLQVFDQNGMEVLSQITRYDAARGELHFIFAAHVPSLGAAVYDVHTDKPSTLTSTLSVNEVLREISNGHYTVRLNQYGDITRLYDQIGGRSLVSQVQQQLFDDTSTSFPSWEIRYDDVKAAPRAKVDENVKIELVEDGALRKCFRVARSKEGSDFVQYVRMTAVSNRIDCVNEVDWQSQGNMLKANFSLMFSNPTTTYDMSLGTIERGVRTSSLYEVQGHQWADVSTTAKTFGVSILNDCKYGWDKPSTNAMHLTLIHTPKVGDSYSYQAQQDLGVNLFTYALYPHDGGWSEQTQKEASQLNQPLVAFVADKHDGSLGKQLSFISLNTDKVAVKAVKKAEETDELIVRVYEWAGKDEPQVALSFPSEIVSAREVNALEETVGTAQVSGKQLMFGLTKYQPRTFAVRLQAPEVAPTVEKVVSTPVALDYNVDMMSFDGKRNDASADIVYAYPAELMPETLVADNVEFSFGSKTDGQKNALRCAGQTLTIDRSVGQQKLYLLLASAEPNGSTAEFLMGDVANTLHVPYYSGTVGQLASPFNTGTSYRSENIALAVTHSHAVGSSSNETMRQLYIYKYVLPLPRGVNSITLPRNSNLYVLAATVSNNKSDNVLPFSEIGTYIDYAELGDASGKCGEQLAPDYVVASHQTGNHEAARMAADDDMLTKWCATDGQSHTPWLEYRFSEPKTICSWMVLNAGSEQLGYVSKAFKLQTYEDGAWKDVDIVADNTDNRVERGVAPFTTSRVRLQMIDGEQGDGFTTRIYEFAVYGQGQSTGIRTINDLQAKEIELVGNMPNPCAQTTTVTFRAAEAPESITMEVFAQSGKLVDSRQVALAGAGSRSFVWQGSLPSGVYLYRLVARKGSKVMKSNIKKLVISTNY